MSETDKTVWQGMLPLMALPALLPMGERRYGIARSIEQIS
jgi:hypothetical protein